MLWQAGSVTDQLVLLLFTARCYAERGIAMAKSTVCLSVRPSVTLKYPDHIGWNSYQIISPIVSLVCLLFEDPNVTDLTQGEYPEILSGIVEGYRESGFRRTKALISLKRSKMTKITTEDQ